MTRNVRLAWLTTLAVASAPGARAQPNPLAFTALSPCRIVDTRSSSGGALAGNETRTFHVVGSTSDFAGQGGLSGGCGIPGYVGATPQAQAVVFNFVAVSATGAGNLRAWATDKPQPDASTLNYAKILDQTTGLPFNIANGIVIPVSQDPVEGADLSIRASVSGTDVVVDVVGYYSVLNSPFAFGQIREAGSIRSGSSTLVSAERVGTGLYCLTFSSAPAQDRIEGAVVGLAGSGSDALFARVTNGQAGGANCPSGQLDIKIVNASGTLTDGRFSFIVP